MAKIERSTGDSRATYLINQVAQHPIKYPSACSTADQDA
jgi:hypothetical protein